ncbi:MAG: NAD(P)/FAD-dependent oxidoreductase [Desulfobulbaceae bacterium]|uniref:NAD(P)/FAD-dependent oxidoreductase n=1 Tax=Candidatus Desulfatifera sulfidica TaxID=2841691 RepID=A0A8J6TDJ8_9BACT|nr:NAD(P)/FAD-dependent oxidoreductase [Candidatus Desulfatifera sulfidica]
MPASLVIIGGGLSGLAAAIRFARFNPNVLILEQHSRIGGLNSYYYRNNRLFETGLHAITNFASPGDKRAPLNRLFRQLKLKRDLFDFHEQIESEIIFTGNTSLRFSNDFDLLRSEIETAFPSAGPDFDRLLSLINEYDPFAPRPFVSARQILGEYLNNPLLVDMLLCPLMYYGSSVINDMDLGQFVIMFRAIFQEGMFRPGGTIKDLLDVLLASYQNYGGKIRLKSSVSRILRKGNKVVGVELDSGEVINCEFVISTIGYEETLALYGESIPVTENTQPRLGFMESIFEVPVTALPPASSNRTIIFFNQGSRFLYQPPENVVHFASGVICFPSHFQDLPLPATAEIRTTHLANYQLWHDLSQDRSTYLAAKLAARATSRKTVEEIIGQFSSHILYEDTFTPLTIERYTGKKEGAIYGRPEKIKNGVIGHENLFLAGTDQGFLGIVGSMLSGVSMVNQHILPKI